MAKILITSALPYINGVKHLGNLTGSLLPADVHARFRRQIGDDVLFICATDEHGTPAELAAHADGLDVATIQQLTLRYGGSEASAGGRITPS
jgi:methionyl-tRNA synthetase